MITYLRYTAGTNKGGVEDGRLFNSVYRIGNMDEDRARYTSAVISETHKANAEEVAAHSFALDWAPVSDIKSIKIGATVYTVIDSAAAAPAVADTSVKVDALKGIVTFAEGDTKFVDTAEVKVLYAYDNIVVPQTSTPTSLPTLKAELAHIDLHAHARRIAIYYSQIAAFQAKNDYGFDMGQQLATQAQGELAYEIDSEGVMMLSNGAQKVKGLKFKTYEYAMAGSAMYVSRSQYYETFTEIIARAKQVIYTRTQKFAPNFMVVGAQVLTILPFLKGWTAAPASVVNGPYFAGTVDGLKVFVSPAIASTEFFFGVNGSDLQSAAGVYAPYMAVVPTQLLGLPDGTQTQGFSTMYDMKLLSTYDFEDGEFVEHFNDGETGKYSFLLAKGAIVTEDTDSAFDVDATSEIV